MVPAQEEQNAILVLVAQSEQLVQTQLLPISS